MRESSMLVVSQQLEFISALSALLDVDMLSVSWCDWCLYTYRVTMITGSQCEHLITM